MKRLAILLIPILLLLSCRKTTAGSGARSFTGPNPAIEGTLLIREVSHFPAGDSFVTTYQYDAALRLTAMLRSAPPALNLNSNTYYARDDQERIIRRIIMADSIADTMYVFYASPALGIVSYTIDQSGTSYRDSAAYTYNPDHYTLAIAYYPLTVLPAQLGSIDSITYDANGNVSEFRTFMPGTGGQLSLNLGYDFDYDTDINPLYSPDDCRIADEGAAIISPNNQLKQTNQYGDPPLMPGNYVTWTYQYRSDQKPSTAATGGTPASPGSVPVTTFYYQ